MSTVSTTQAVGGVTPSRPDAAKAVNEEEEKEMNGDDFMSLGAAEADEHEVDGAQKRQRRKRARNRKGRKKMLF